ncbi:MAG: TetR/AcrR family transcriptional regulator [Syntrophomonas sp.]
MGKNQRQQQKEQTRQTLLETAFSEFGRRGIMATRMSDIAGAAGVSHGTVFAHFENQEALISAVIEEFGEKITFRTHELAGRCQGVQDLLVVHLLCIEEYEAFYTRLVNEARFLPQVARDTFIMIQSAVSFHISQAAGREMEQGSIIEMPLHLFFNTWVGLVHYYLNNSDLFAREDSVIKRYGPSLLEHFMSLVKAHK